MDTIQALETDTISAAFTEQPQPRGTEYSPFKIFKNGIIGVFTFVLLYVLIIKITAILTKKYKKNKNDDT